MKKWYQGPDGEVSSTRIVVVPGAYLALSVVAAATVAFFCRIEGWELLAGIGTGLITILAGFKTLSKNTEEKASS